MTHQTTYRWFASIFMVIALGLAACGGGAPADDGGDSSGESGEMSEMADSIAVADQTLDMYNMVTVAEVSAAADGWVVIHAEADGKPGPVLGYAAVSAGHQENVTVEIDPAGATEKVFAMLHVDAGTAGEYEFPDGPDVPVKDASDNVVVVPFMLGTEGGDDMGAEDSDDMGGEMADAITVADQTLDMPNMVTVAGVTAAVDGWVVIHAEADGKPGPILGYAAVSAGEHSDVTVEIDPEGATEKVFAMLHVDAGTAGEYEFPDGEDVPVKDADGNVVLAPFMLSMEGGDDMGGEMADSITVADQTLDMYNMVTIAGVTAAVDGWVVIHAEADGKPGPILGYAAVSAGENSDVAVEIDPEGATEKVFAMLHVDAGVVGEYEFPDGEDVPVKDADGNVVLAPFMLSTE